MQESEASVSSPSPMFLPGTSPAGGTLFPRPASTTASPGMGVPKSGAAAPSAAAAPPKPGPAITSEAAAAAVALPSDDELEEDEDEEESAAPPSKRPGSSARGLHQRGEASDWCSSSEEGSEDGDEVVSGRGEYLMVKSASGSESWGLGGDMLGMSVLQLVLVILAL